MHHLHIPLPVLVAPPYRLMPVVLIRAESHVNDNADRYSDSFSHGWCAWWARALAICAAAWRAWRACSDRSNSPLLRPPTTPYAYPTARWYSLLHEELLLPCYICRERAVLSLTWRSPVQPGSCLHVSSFPTFLVVLPVPHRRDRVMAKRRRRRT